MSNKNSHKQTDHTTTSTYHSVEYLKVIVMLLTQKISMITMMKIITRMRVMRIRMMMPMTMEMKVILVPGKSRSNCQSFLALPQLGAPKPIFGGDDDDGT